MRWTVGPYIFDPSKNILEGPEGKTLLEPKASSLLNYFIQNPSRDLSRDELLQNVWDGQIVSDGAINRVVVQLRKNLSDDSKIKHLIVTVPKVGYRFVGTIEPAPEPSQKMKQKTFRHSTTAIIGLVLLPIFALVYFSNTQQQTPPTNANLSPIVRLSNEQFNAAPSPLTEQIVYSQITDTGSQLFLGKTSGTEQHKIGAEGGSAQGATWAPKDNMLVYRFIAGNACAFHMIHFQKGTASAPQTIYECMPSDRISFAFSANGKKLYFTEQETEFAPSHIYELDIGALTTRRLSQPIAMGRGNFHIDRNPLTGNLLILSDKTPGQTSAYELNTEKNSFTRLMAWKHKVDFAIWGHTPNTVVHPGAHPSYQLMETNYLSGISQILVSDSRRIKEPIRVANGKDYLFTSYLRNFDILFDGQLMANLNSSVMDYLATLSRSGTQLAFISKRTGESRIWIADIETENLTMLAVSEPGQSILTMDWSFDDQRLLITTSAGLRIIDLETQTISNRINPALPAYAARWSAHDEIVYSLYEGGRWQVYRHNIKTGKKTPEDSKWAFVLSSTEATVFLDQNLQLFTPTGHAIDNACAISLKFQDMNMRLYKQDLFCISHNAPTNILKYKNLNEITTITPTNLTARHFSASKDHISQTVLTSSVSDIMRTNFEASP